VVLVGADAYGGRHRLHAMDQACRSGLEKLAVIADQGRAGPSCRIASSVFTKRSASFFANTRGGRSLITLWNGPAVTGRIPRSRRRVTTYDCCSWGALAGFWSAHRSHPRKRAEPTTSA